MGLFNQFVSAAVRQVGRDGGKVISNKVYGNAHSSKINIVSEATQYNSSKNVYSYADQGLEEGDFVHTGSRYFELKFGHWLWLVVLVFVPIPFLGLIGSIIFAYKTFFVKHFITSTPLSWVTVQIKDGRTKDGFREMPVLRPDDSQAMVHKLDIPTPNKVYAILALIISTFITVYIVWVFNYAISHPSLKP